MFYFWFLSFTSNMYAFVSISGEAQSKFVDLYFDSCASNAKFDVQKVYLASLTIVFLVRMLKYGIGTLKTIFHSI